jgi:hypothetical protein
MIRARFGNLPGASLRLKTPRPLVELVDVPAVGRNVQEGVLRHFERIAVMTTGAASARMFVLEPDDDVDEVLPFGELWVRGSFRIVQKVNNARKAAEAWGAFEAA